jgi:hypothetical protein
MGVRELRQPLDLDVDTGKPERRPWSITAMSLPVPVVAVLLVQTVSLVLYFGSQGTKLDSVIESNKEIKAELYKQGDATRDLALRDDRIAELTRRILILEQYIDGRRK